MGRLTFYTKGAVEKLEKLNLFTDNVVVEEKPKEKKTTVKQETKPAPKKVEKKVIKK